MAHYRVGVTIHSQ